MCASGNVVHNLGAIRWGDPGAEPYEWAARFNAVMRAAIEEGDDEALIGYERFGDDAAMSVPTREHFLPLLYVLGARRPGDQVSFPVDGVDSGSVSMLSVQLG